MPCPTPTLWKFPWTKPSGFWTKKNGDVLLIDVREPFETELCRIAGAEHIPMRQIPEHVGTLPKDKHLLIHCHHGGRSLRVTQYLRANGYDAVSNVAGGIDAWSLVIDPAVPRY
jgi:rhodanese-related sulfurtransferase